MSEPLNGADRPVATTPFEIGLSVFFIAVGGLAIADSLRLGAGWGSMGPEAGYFPFLIGAALIGAALVNLAGAIRGRAQADTFVTHSQAKSVAILAVPTLVYVVAIPWLGIYLASALLAFGFLRFLGDASTLKAALSGATIAVVCFVLFDKWFLVSLPKGPVETLLGY
jgi:hypothetical protein